MKCKKCGTLFIGETEMGLCKNCYRDYKMFVLRKKAEELELSSSDVKEVARIMVREEYKEYLRRKEERREKDE
jgi:hypothetical protein